MKPAEEIIKELRELSSDDVEVFSEMILKYQRKYAEYGKRNFIGFDHAMRDVRDDFNLSYSIKHCMYCDGVYEGGFEGKLIGKYSEIKDWFDDFDGPSTGVCQSMPCREKLDKMKKGEDIEISQRSLDLQKRVDKILKELKREFS